MQSQKEAKERKVDWGDYEINAKGWSLYGVWFIRKRVTIGHSYGVNFILIFLQGQKLHHDAISFVTVIRSCSAWYP